MGTVRQYPINQPRPGRLGSRDTYFLKFPVESTGPNISRIRLRSKASGDPVVVAKYDADVMVAQTGNVYVAPVGTPAPTLVRSTLDAAWQEMGFITEEGVTYAEEIDTVPRSSWSSFYPREYTPVARRFTVSLAFREYNKRVVEFATEGAITKSGTEWKKSPAAGDISTKAFIVDWNDGVHLVRLYIPVGSVISNIDSAMQRTAAVDLPVVFGTTRLTGDAYKFFMSNDVGF